jgi:hypothetical protein
MRAFFLSPFWIPIRPVTFKFWVRIGSEDAQTNRSVAFKVSLPLGFPFLVRLHGMFYIKSINGLSKFFADVAVINLMTLHVVVSPHLLVEMANKTKSVIHLYLLVSEPPYGFRIQRPASLLHLLIHHKDVKQKLIEGYRA